MDVVHIQDYSLLSITIDNKEKIIDKLLFLWLRFLSISHINPYQLVD